MRIYVYDKKPLETVLGIETIRDRLSSMEAAEAAISKLPEERPGIWDWRLHASPFYFKFRETTRPNARDDSLVRGITLGVDQLRGFLGLSQSDGERGGKRIGYENCPRYFSNTQFVGLAREGWIGCDPRGFAFISDLLRRNQQSGKLAMLAAVQGIAAVDASNRGRRS